MSRHSRHSFCVAGLALGLVLLTATAGFARNKALVIAEQGAEAIADHQLDAVDLYENDGADLVVVKLAPGQSVSDLRQQLSSDGGIHAVDELFVAALSPPSATDPATHLADLADSSDGRGLAASPCLDAHLADGAWASWSEQAASWVTHVSAAQSAAGHCGEGVTVAIIDTGVDAEHELLRGAVTSGSDFLSTSNLDGSEWNSLNPATGPTTRETMRAGASQTFFSILEQSMREIAQGGTGDLDQTFFSILESGSITVLLAQDDLEAFDGLDLPPLFGHGTMVAGLIRLVAPGAQIMPLRAFDGYGVGQSTDIVRAIYYAVDHGADVINMSFSMDRKSAAIAEALRYARANGVVVVAAAGNRGVNDVSYPASDSKVIGVAASDQSDGLADFSNFGPNNADLAAPGVALISAYPGGYYAAGWGTSFSTPLVAGAAALLRFGQPDDAGTHRAVVEDILTGTEYVGLQGEVLTGGRLDVLGAVEQSFD